MIIIIIIFVSSMPITFARAMSIDVDTQYSKGVGWWGMEGG